MGSVGGPGVAWSFTALRLRDEFSLTDQLGSRKVLSALKIPCVCVCSWLVGAHVCAPAHVFAFQETRAEKQKKTMREFLIIAATTKERKPVTRLFLYTAITPRSTVCII